MTPFDSIDGNVIFWTVILGFLGAGIYLLYHNLLSLKNAATDLQIVFAGIIAAVGSVLFGLVPPATDGPTALAIVVIGFSGTTIIDKWVLSGIISSQTNQTNGTSSTGATPPPGGT